MRPLHCKAGSSPLDHWGNSSHRPLQNFQLWQKKKKKRVQWGKESSDGTLEVAMEVKEGHSEDMKPEAWDTLEALGCDPDKA